MVNTVYWCPHCKVPVIKKEYARSVVRRVNRCLRQGYVIQCLCRKGSSFPASWGEMLLTAKFGTWVAAITS